MRDRTLNSGERQVEENVSEVRHDHVARYQWAAKECGGQAVVDVGCGIGYGSRILAESGCNVRAFDDSAESVAYAEEHYSHPGIKYYEADAELACYPTRETDCVVAFEILEHLSDPGAALRKWRGMADRLLLSVPNETLFPINKYCNFHERHYTGPQIEELLNNCGYEVVGWFAQENEFSDLEQNTHGRTWVLDCWRADNPVHGTFNDLPPSPPPIPKTVAIVAMGSSKQTWTNLAAQFGNRYRRVDEVWAINSMAGVILHDRVYAMDDFRMQLKRAEAHPTSNIGGLIETLQQTDAPVYTSTVYPELPNAVEYPLKFVCTRTGHKYFNNTVPYAIAHAIAIGVKRISLFGVDYSYEDKPGDESDSAHKRESGRGCVEYWLGVAGSLGVEIEIAADSSLMDADVGDEREFYGYDAWDIEWTKDDDGFHFTKTAKELPTVAEIDARYVHDERAEYAMKNMSDEQRTAFHKELELQREAVA